MPSGKEARSSTLREAIVVELRDTCKALDETIKTCTMRNINLDNVIKAVTEERVMRTLLGMRVMRMMIQMLLMIKMRMRKHMQVLTLDFPCFSSC